MQRLALLVALALTLAACGGANLNPDAGPTPHTTLSPPPGPFNGTLAVTLTSNIPATVYVTTDGTDPHQADGGRLSGASPLTVTLTQTTPLSYFSQTASGAAEAVQTAQYVRAGGKPGTISGNLVVGPVATNVPIAVVWNSFNVVSLPQATQAASVPYTLQNLPSGTYALVGWADRDQDGLFIPGLDYSSATYSVTLDLTDPFKASVEGLDIYLGASPAGLGTISGTVTIPNAPLANTLSLAALSPADLTGLDAGLIQRLQNGYRVLTTPTQSAYPYALTNLQPGLYVPIPALVGFTAGGLDLNVLLRPLSPVNLAAGQIAREDFAYGPIGITGLVTDTPATLPDAGAVVGVVAARHTDLGSGTVQSVLMSVLFAPDGGQFVGAYGGTSLASNASFDLKAFTSIESSDPLGDALSWAVNPLDARPPKVTVPVGTTDVVQDLSAP